VFNKHTTKHRLLDHAKQTSIDKGILKSCSTDIAIWPGARCGLLHPINWFLWKTCGKPRKTLERRETVFKPHKCESGWHDPATNMSRICENINITQDLVGGFHWIAFKSHSRSFTTSTCTARRALRHAECHRNFTDKYHQKNETFPLVKCVRLYVRNLLLIILVLVWRKSIHFWRKCARKTILTFSFTMTLTFGL